MEAEILLKTTEKLILSGTKNDIPLAQQTIMVTEIPSKKNSKITSSSCLDNTQKDGVILNVENIAVNSKIYNTNEKKVDDFKNETLIIDDFDQTNNIDDIIKNCEDNVLVNDTIDTDGDGGATGIINNGYNVINNIKNNCNNGTVGFGEKMACNSSTTNGYQMKTKRKRRRGKPKANSKVYKKTNWKFQMPPRYRNGNNNNNNNNNSNDNGNIGGVRKFVRSTSIVPYNTNKFLMEEHMAEVPSALLTPSGRTRDSSFSVDSEDNYFFSLPEDEEEFLTKEFANVYEKARVERLEGLTKQQLIEECLQLEDRYAQSSGVQQNGTVELINKIRLLEEKIRDLNSENFDLRRKLDPNGKFKLQSERMCSSSSEDSESDSSSSSSSCASSEYSRNSRRSSISCDMNDDNNSRMDSDDIIGGPYEQNGGDLHNDNGILLMNGQSNYSSPSNSRINSPTQQQQQIGANCIN